MTTLSDYLEGVMRVPLRLLTSDGFSECPASFSDGASVPDFEHFLNNRTQPITGIVSPQKLKEMLGELVVTQQEFRQTITGQEPLSNVKFQIDCLIGQHCLDKAKQLLGSSYVCTVRIYGIPLELPGRYSDGEICRQILLLSQKQPSTAQRWLERLSRGKRKHVTMVFHRRGIWSAMEDVAIFTGLWDDIKLGNWAKHLAAHIDEQIQNYWKHIYQVWNSHIFAGVDSGLRQFLDAQSARFLQFMTPAWSLRDQKAIRKRMNNGSLFCNISDKEVRSTLLRNILCFKGVIPSILTFHENMRYLTVGAKILEKHVEVKRPTEKAGPDLVPAKTPESLFANLEQDWGKGVVPYHVECHEGQYQPTRSPLYAHLAFVQLFLAALRWFPFLSSETPLQDVKGLGMPAYPDDYRRRRLCMTARSLGFSNKMIEDGVGLPAHCATREMPDFLPLCTESAWRGWRGGMPTISVFEELSTKSFLPTLESAAREIDELEPNSTLIQSDFIKAFFGSFNVVDDSRPIFDTTRQPSPERPNFATEAEMDWVEARPEVMPTFEGEAATTTGPVPRPSRPRTQTRDRRKGRTSKAQDRTDGYNPFKLRKKANIRKKKEKANQSSLERMALLDSEPNVPEPPQRLSVPMLDEPGASLRSEEQPNSDRREHEQDAQEQQERDVSPNVPDTEHRISEPHLEQWDVSSSRTNLQGARDITKPGRSVRYFPLHRPRVERDIDPIEIRGRKKNVNLSGEREVKRIRVEDDIDPEVPDRHEDRLVEIGPDEIEPEEEL